MFPAAVNGSPNFRIQTKQPQFGSLSPSSHLSRCSSLPDCLTPDSQLVSAKDRKAKKAATAAVEAAQGRLTRYTARLGELAAAPKMPKIEVGALEEVCACPYDLEYVPSASHMN